ncbi:F-box protein [Durusdinium trenchii]|uniref:F-box protein n=1 Tax=Durusdinium trenchii TaxID=1381693 RepID=A0ABP0KW71_9DINO
MSSEEDEELGPVCHCGEVMQILDSSVPRSRGLRERTWSCSECKERKARCAVRYTCDACNVEACDECAWTLGEEDANSTPEPEEGEEGDDDWAYSAYYVVCDGEAEWWDVGPLYCEDWTDELDANVLAKVPDAELTDAEKIKAAEDIKVQPKAYPLPISSPGAREVHVQQLTVLQWSQITPRLPERIPACQAHRLRFCPQGAAQEQLQPEIAPPTSSEIYAYSHLVVPLGSPFGWWYGRVERIERGGSGAAVTLIFPHFPTNSRWYRLRVVVGDGIIRRCGIGGYHGGIRAVTPEEEKAMGGWDEVGFYGRWIKMMEQDDGESVLKGSFEQTYHVRPMMTNAEMVGIGRWCWHFSKPPFRFRLGCLKPLGLTFSYLA